ncbi:MAG: hypothetical protein ACO1PZ_06595 [Gammaproteobacteria bacterium]
MKKLALSISALAMALAGTAIAQDGVIYPANAENVSYAELDKLPDWRGIWQPAIGRVGGDQPQLIGEYKERYEAERAKVAADPNYEIPEGMSNCEPDGMPTMMTMPYSLEFLFTPGKIVVNQEALMMVRRIYTDGRPLPSRDEIEPNYFGYSVGHWEGDTLVVETIGTKAGQRLGEAGITNSEELKITERIYLDPDNKDMLHLDFTFEDPNVLAQPWHRTHTFRRDRTWEILEYVCAENDRHPLDAEGQTQADF